MNNLLGVKNREHTNHSMGTQVGEHNQLRPSAAITKAKHALSILGYIDYSGNKSFSQITLNKMIEWKNLIRSTSLFKSRPDLKSLYPSHCIMHNMGLGVMVSVTSRTQPHILRVTLVRFEVHLDM